MDSLLTLCREAGYISGKMPATDDITTKWDSMSPSYIKDALHEINDYHDFFNFICGSGSDPMSPQSPLESRGSVKVSNLSL